MLDLRIHNESLDLAPDAQMEVEENNQYLQFGDEIKGEYSLPIEVPATAKNTRLLKYAPVFQSRLGAAGIEAIAYDSGFQHSMGKLKVERVQHNLNDGNSPVSLFYLTGTSFFWQDCKGKTTRNADFGGDRSFSWDAFNRSGNGFWGHIHRVMDAPAGYGASGYDYAFFPLIIEDIVWGNGCGTNMINRMAFVNGQPTFTQKESYNKDANFIAPFPYLKYVLQQVVACTGWAIEGPALNDPQFAKVVLINQRAINWAPYLPFAIKNNFPPVGRTTIIYNLIDHVPDVDISTFLLWIRNRFGFWYDIDRLNKKIRVRRLTEVAAGAKKDMTAKASPVITKTAYEEKKVYGLRNTGQEQELSLSGYAYDGTVPRDLPPASASLEGHVRLVIEDNNYYEVVQTDSGAWSWQKLAANTADVAPIGATDYLTGGTTVLSGEAYNGYLDMIMRSGNTGFWAGRNDDNQDLTLVELCFYYGRQPNNSGQAYPFAHHHIYNRQGTQIGSWSLSFKGQKKDGTEVGLYDVSFKPFLDKLVSTEEVELTLYLTRAEFMALRFSDVYHISGAEFYTKTRKYVLPFKGAVTLQCLRVRP